MKICIPILRHNGYNSPISEHFGQSSGFALFDDDTDTLSFMLNSGLHSAGAQTPAELIAESGADVVLCGSLGVKAVHLFEQHGIHVYSDASGTVVDAVNAYKADRLPEVTDATACQSDAH